MVWKIKKTLYLITVVVAIRWNRKSETDEWDKWKRDWNSKNESGFFFLFWLF